MTHDEAIDAWIGKCDDLRAENAALRSRVEQLEAAIRTHREDRGTVSHRRDAALYAVLREEVKG